MTSPVPQQDIKEDGRWSLKCIQAPRAFKNFSDFQSFHENSNASKRWSLVGGHLFPRSFLQ